MDLDIFGTGSNFVNAFFSSVVNITLCINLYFMKITTFCVNLYVICCNTVLLA